MELAELIECLTRGKNTVFTSPMTPSDAAKLIVTTLLSEFPEERRNDVRNAIEEWGTAWGDLVGSVIQHDMDR
jgi:hypothetical protein